MVTDDVIDLCSDTEEPPPCRQQQEQQNNEVVDLLSDQEEQEISARKGKSSQGEENAPIVSSPTPSKSITTTTPLTTTPKMKGTLLDYFSVRQSSKKLVTNQQKRMPISQKAHKLKVKRSMIEVKTEEAFPLSTVAADAADPDITVVEPPTPVAVTGNGAEADDDDGENECMIVGQKGNNALSDFPHPRADCVVHPVGTADDDAAAAERYCPKCYCFVCDSPVAQCQFWKPNDGNHCRAKFKNYFWKCERNRKRCEKDQYAPRLDPSSRPIKRRRNNMTAPVVRPRQLAAPVVRRAIPPSFRPRTAEPAPPVPPSPVATTTHHVPPTTTASPNLTAAPKMADAPKRGSEHITTPHAASIRTTPTKRATAALKKKTTNLAIRATPIARMTASAPTVPQISPWINSMVKLIGIDMTDAEEIQYKAVCSLRQMSDRVTSVNRMMLQEGARPAALEMNVTAPLSIYSVTMAWTVQQLQERSSKIQGLVQDLLEVRKNQACVVAVVFCQNPKWRNAIAAALVREKFIVMGDIGPVARAIPQASGLVRVLSTFPVSGNSSIPPCQRVYFMEQYINMAWESIALGRIKRPNTAQRLEVRKVVLKKTAEENVVSLQNAFITGAVKMEANGTKVDKVGVEILLRVSGTG